MSINRHPFAALSAESSLLATVLTDDREMLGEFGTRLLRRDDHDGCDIDAVV